MGLRPCGSVGQGWQFSNGVSLAQGRPEQYRGVSPVLRSAAAWESH